MRVEGIERLFTVPSRFARWVLVPSLIGFSVALPAMQYGEELPVRGGFVVAFVSGTSLLLAVGLVSPRRCRWALRLCAALVALAYCAHVLTEFVLVGEGERQANVGQALLGLFLIGLPAVRYAWRGTFLPRGPEHRSMPPTLWGGARRRGQREPLPPPTPPCAPSG